MKSARFYPAVLCLAVLLASGCGSNPTTPSSPATPAVCVPSSKPQFSYVLTGYAVSMFSVDSCTGKFTATTPASVATGYTFPQNSEAEQMAVDPLGRFAYVANPVSNVSGPSSISMFTINSTTGLLTPTTPATVPTGWFPQEIAIDPHGRFVYTANTDDATVSMFTVNQTTGVLTPTSPASVSTMVPGMTLSQPLFLTVDPSGKFLYVTALLTDDAGIFMYSIDQTTGLLTPTSPARVLAAGSPWQVVVAPNGKFAYAVNNGSGGQYTIGVEEYTVNSTNGVLTPNTGTPNTVAFVAAGNAPTAVAVDPTSRFAYVVNRNDNSVSMYTIDPATGNLTPNAFSSTIATGVEPFRIAFDPTGKFVYVTNERDAASIFTVNANGTLAGAGNTGVAGLATALSAAQ